MLLSFCSTDDWNEMYFVNMQYKKTVCKVPGVFSCRPIFILGYYILDTPKRLFHRYLLNSTVLFFKIIFETSLWVYCIHNDRRQYVWTVITLWWMTRDSGATAGHRRSLSAWLGGNANVYWAVVFGCRSGVPCRRAPELMYQLFTRAITLH